LLEPCWISRQGAPLRQYGGFGLGLPLTLSEQGAFGQPRSSLSLAIPLKAGK